MTVGRCIGMRRKSENLMRQQLGPAVRAEEKTGVFRVERCWPQAQDANCCETASSSFVEAVVASGRTVGRHL